MLLKCRSIAITRLMIASSCPSGSRALDRRALNPIRAAPRSVSTIRTGSFGRLSTRTARGLKPRRTRAHALFAHAPALAQHARGRERESRDPRSTSSSKSCSRSQRRPTSPPAFVLDPTSSRQSPSTNSTSSCRHSALCAPPAFSPWRLRLALAARPRLAPCLSSAPSRLLGALPFAVAPSAVLPFVDPSPPVSFYRPPVLSHPFLGWGIRPRALTRLCPYGGGAWSDPPPPTPTHTQSQSRATGSMWSNGSTNGCQT